MSGGKRKNEDVSDTMALVQAACKVLAITARPLAHFRHRRQPESAVVCTVPVIRVRAECEPVPAKRKAEARPCVCGRARGAAQVSASAPPSGAQSRAFALWAALFQSID